MLDHTRQNSVLNENFCKVDDMHVAMEQLDNWSGMNVLGL